MVRGKIILFLSVTLFIVTIPVVSLAQLPTVDLAKTGQTTSYGANDDGDLEIGVAHPSPRFTNNGNGTITDNLTGLIWLRNGDCGGGSVDWDTAFTYINELNASGTMNSNNCGDTSNGGSHQTDWRLPNVLELESLLNLGQANNAVWLTGQGFTNIPGNPAPIGDYSERYHSSTTHAGDTADSFHVQITEARVRHEVKTSPWYVWAVRGGN